MLNEALTAREATMSRRIWLDRTIDAARAADIRLPWDRRPVPEPTAERAADRAVG